MKYLLNIFFIIFLLLPTSLLKAENKVVYLDINKIMNISKAGKSINDQLQKMHESDIENFKLTESKLKKEEKNVISQKNILNTTDYEAKMSSLRESVSNYRKQRESKINALTNKRIEAKKNLLNALKPILTEYSKENSISLLLQKKNIIMGSAELDITDQILELVDKKISSIAIN